LQGVCTFLLPLALTRECKHPNDYKSISLVEILSADAESDTDNGNGIQVENPTRTRFRRITDCPLFTEPRFPTAAQIKKLLDSVEYEITGRTSTDRIRQVMDSRKSKVSDNDFDSGEQNEKGLDVVVGICFW